MVPEYLKSLTLQQTSHPIDQNQLLRSDLGKYDFARDPIPLTRHSQDLRGSPYPSYLLRLREIEDYGRQPL